MLYLAETSRADDLLSHSQMALNYAWGSAIYTHQVSARTAVMFPAEKSKIQVTTQASLDLFVVNPSYFRKSIMFIVVYKYASGVRTVLAQL